MPGFKKYSYINNKILFTTTTCLALITGSLVYAQIPILSTPTEWGNEPISKITIFGNKTVTKEAILNLMTIKVGHHLNQGLVSSNIKAIYASSFFQDVKFDKGPQNELIVYIVEKPTIYNIIYDGFNIVSSSSLKDKIISKKYTIIDEKKLAQDLRTIEQAYIEKGYYLAKPNYTLEEIEPGSVDVVFHVNENTPIQVRSVNIIGNEYFSHNDLQNFMMTRPYSWLSILTNAGLFRDEFIAADQQNMTYYYRDNGYAEATAASPLATLDKNKRDINISFFIEEGERFNIGKITVTGDVIGTESNIKEKLSLKENEIYRISKFNADMKTLKTIYGDQGFAFAYIYPTFNIDRVKKTYDIVYNITKGEKAYFRKINLEGNVKTRDNVIRRALRISEGELFNSSKLDKSKANIERQGFFEFVQIIQEPDQANHAIDLKVVIKEKPTGRISASIGASPGVSGSGVTVFGQGQYQEPNFIGKAYNIGVNAQLSPSPENNGKMNYTFSLNFSNPSVFDSPWSFGFSGTFSHNISLLTSSDVINKVYITQNTKSLSLNVGREVFENARFSLGYSISDTATEPSLPLTSKFYSSGKSEKLSQGLTYDDTDNYLNPTSGLHINLSNSIGVKGLYGQYSFGSASAVMAYYLPLNFSDNFKTNFRFSLMPRYVYQLSKTQPVPIWERPTLGNAYYMKGYSGPGEIISPSIPITISTLMGQTVNFSTGGNRSLYSSIEYFVPVIPQAGLRFVLFGEAGTVLDDYDSFSINSLKYDVGFGFRWMTPVAPFRFEWAFPVDQNGHIGDAHFVFTIGTDSLNNM
jgi:outer membrane protein insertion porin family